MPRFTLIAFFGFFLAGIASAAPIPAKVGLIARANATTTFTEEPYSEFQISDGVGGTAVDQANAVFVGKSHVGQCHFFFAKCFLEPFANVDLTTISADTLDAINSMRLAAESAETDEFDPQIDAASGATGTDFQCSAALQVGKIKNKVLKLTAEIEDINIKIAQAQASGADTSSLESDLSSEQTKLNSNIALDQANAGKMSQGVA
ncbi:hypothetical protein BDP27DRAFT_1371143 [Rhodocollybia butyracea]|uniref:Uncharacterized protein n=1 Tax=Rhodocollybia butyracea TaxID=206335 RepID=A0A9P5P7N4_9AGAR|nr:hypothetical protein BDP27DRAFT_1371143 [Rhodocollybia butyracea]